MANRDLGGAALYRAGIEADSAMTDYEALGYSETAAGTWDLDQMRALVTAITGGFELATIACPLADEG